MGIRGGSMLTGEQEAVSWPRALTLHLGVSAHIQVPGRRREAVWGVLAHQDLPHHFTVTSGEPPGGLHQPKTPAYIFRLNLTRKTQVCQSLELLCWSWTDLDPNVSFIIDQLLASVSSAAFS